MKASVRLAICVANTGGGKLRFGQRFARVHRHYAQMHQGICHMVKEDGWIGGYHLEIRDWLSSSVN